MRVARASLVGRFRDEFCNARSLRQVRPKSAKRTCRPLVSRGSSERLPTRREMLIGARALALAGAGSCVASCCATNCNKEQRQRESERETDTETEKGTRKRKSSRLGRKASRGRSHYLRAEPRVGRPFVRRPTQGRRPAESECVPLVVGPISHSALCVGSQLCVGSEDKMLQLLAQGIGLESKRATHGLCWKSCVCVFVHLSAASGHKRTPVRAYGRHSSNEATLLIGARTLVRPFVCARGHKLRAEPLSISTNETRVWF